MVDVACTAPAAPASSSAPKDQTAESGAESEKASADAPITVKVGWSRGANITYPEGDNMENNAWTRAYEEAGYKLDFSLVTVPEQYQQKLALSIASKDLPDIWMSDKKNFYLAMEGCYCMDLTDMKQKCLSDLSKQYVDEYDLPFRAATIDGKLLAFPELNEDHSYVGGVTLSLTGSCRAGLLLTYSTEHFIGAEWDGDTIQLYRHGKKFECIPARGTQLRFYLRNLAHDVAFYYSLDKGKVRKINYVVARESMNAVAYGGFASLRPGFFAYGGGEAEFTDFTYSPGAGLGALHGSGRH